MLVLDRSGSMNTGNVCATMRNAARAFVSRFANGSDTLGLITFMGSAHVDYNPNLNFQPDLTTTLGSINCGGATGTAQALSLALSQYKDGHFPNAGALNIVLLFTDGQPTAVAAEFKIINPNCITTSDNGMLNGYITNAPVPIGMYDATGEPLTAIDDPLPPQISDASGCAFQDTADYGGDAPAYVPQDTNVIPDKDSSGNATTGYWTNSGQQITMWDPSSIQAASFNTADNAAHSIRDAKIQIYVIGESGGINATATELLQRVANVPQSTSYNASQPVGYYVYAPTGRQLASAFNTIALQILRLTQ